jgi:demethylmenaquinone methyltransferase/2-methoxy-6-polyprenyl-1,4-benzoquinol methylase
MRAGTPTPPRSTAALIGWLDARRPRKVLELACGTGLFHPHLAPRTDHVTALDASSEVLAINRARVGGRQRGVYRGGSVYLAAAAAIRRRFFQLLAVARAAGSLRRILGDGATGARAGRRCVPHRLRFRSHFDRERPRASGQSDGVVTRRLNDGREFRIVKVFYEPGDLTERLRRIGWMPRSIAPPNYFIYGSAEPHAGDSM